MEGCAACDKLRLAVAQKTHDHVNSTQTQEIAMALKDAALLGRLQKEAEETWTARRQAIQTLMEHLNLVHGDGFRGVSTKT
jgi:molybdenum cofactor biosynthesis enzyme MoaA